MTCTEPDEDGDCTHEISSYEPGLCLHCLHTYGIARQMGKSTVPGLWMCMMCAHGVG
ncbi:hypothetical protein [Mycobacterium sp. AZCC_0083]|uniref:hypothetical protein n=1 Tax=Mycobacterium sp. AZCC_0083 TaxID=2735882 RepID=UPI00161432A5|nr:hypothetical protein [Mycobacterium sp. AZCC_0083]MBB5167181.1 hypothetical protein [Mycobacterium sp. AZCC_0083]